MDLTPKSRGTSSKPIIHNDQQFVLGYPLKDGTLLYKCCERSCLARIKVDEKNFLVLKELSNHSGHRSPLTNSAKAKTQSNSSIINDKVDATHSNVADTSAASNPRHDALKKSCSTPSANQSHHESEASEPRRSRSSADLSSTFDISHTSAPGTQDAPRTSPIPSAGALSHHEELEEQKTLVSSLLTTVRTLEAALGVKDHTGSTKSKAPTKRNEHRPTSAPSKSKSKAPPSKSREHVSTSVAPLKRHDNKSKVILVGDSHVRQLQNVLAAKISPNFEVQSIYRGGSTLGQSLDLMQERGVSVSASDAIILFSGSNDVSKTSWSNMKKSYTEFVSGYGSCRVGVVLIPPRRGEHHLNSHISHMNQKIAGFLTSKNVTLFDPQSVLGSADYSPDGLHLNKIGKEKICELFRLQWSGFFGGDVEINSPNKNRRRRTKRKNGNKNNNVPNVRRSFGKSYCTRQGPNRQGHIYYNSNYLPVYSNVNSGPEYQWADRSRYDYDFNQGGYDDYNYQYDNHNYYSDTYNVRYRDLKRLDSDVLEDRFAAVDWLTPLSNVTLDEMVQLLSGQITEVFDDVAPIVEKRATRPPIPWMNADVKNNMRFLKGLLVLPFSA
ncbi:hypothetical protein M8J75_005550 [Diaphorina citri]|nr:hypothetical protein M8J75_005550 [Diaphorina citri]